MVLRHALACNMDISGTLDGATAWQGSQQVSRVEWLKKGLFGIFHSMTETTSSSTHVKTRQQVWRVSLLAIDAMQVAVLALRLDYGWSARWFGWLQNMSLLGWLLPDVRPEWYNIVYAVVVLMVWVALIDAAYVFEAWGNARRRRTHSPDLLQLCRLHVPTRQLHINRHRRLEAPACAGAHPVDRWLCAHLWCPHLPA